jgi:hypothetical protein
MSTKIHNGYYLSHGINELSFEQIINRKYPALIEYARGEVIKSLTSKYLRKTFSQLSRSADVPVNEIIRNAFNETVKSMEKDIKSIASGVRVGDLDVTCSISIKRRHGRVYAGLFSDNSKITQWITDNLPLQNFAYFNNTDRPSHISDYRWKKRGRTWDKLFSSSYSWNKAGFVNIPLISTDDVKLMITTITLQDWLSAIPEERYYNIADKAYQIAFLDKQSLLLAEIKNISPRAAYFDVLDALELMKTTSEYKEVTDTFKAKINQSLPYPEWLNEFPGFSDCFIT